MRQTLQIHITLLNKMIYVSLLHCFISYGSLVNLRWISTSFYLTHNNFQRTWDWCRTRVWNEQNRIFFQNFRCVNISRFSIKHMLPCLICKTLSDFCTVGSHVLHLQIYIIETTLPFFVDCNVMPSENLSQTF